MLILLNGCNSSKPKEIIKIVNNYCSLSVPFDKGSEDQMLSAKGDALRSYLIINNTTYHCECETLPEERAQCWEDFYDSTKLANATN